MFKHTIFIPQIIYVYFCGNFLGLMAYKAVVVGASGLIGRKLLNILWHWPEYDEIVSIGRKKINIKNKKLTQLIVDFDHLDSYADQINGHALFCCLGTTKAKTPNPHEYYVIDHDYPVKLAEIAHKNKVGRYHLVSSIGANAGSSSFYLKTKGETENDIKSLGLHCLHIYQPSVLTGHRNDRGLLEQFTIKFMWLVNPLLIGPLRKYQSVPAYKVAMAMFKQSLKNKDGVFIHASDQIKKTK
jgi:nucleoside-diphosphate-sugar epimerase